MVDFNYSAASRIPPAFSGILVDWSIGSREITATLIDLIVRDCLAVIGNKVIISNKKKKRLKFEQEFIDIIFQNKKDLTFKQIKEIVYKKKFNEVEKIICRGMMDEGVIDKEFQAKLAKKVRKTIKAFGNTNMQKKNFKHKQVKTLYIPLWIYKSIFIFAISTYVIRFLAAITDFFFIEFLSSIVSFPIFKPFWFMIILFGVFYMVINKRIAFKKEEMLTTKGKEFKQTSSNLKKFMDKYPQINDRLANELVAHSIAFGIGKRWMKKFGKNTALLKLGVEELNVEFDTTAKFMDFDLYFKQVYNGEENNS